MIVHLGRCAERHPALAGMVIDALRDMDSPKADRLVRRLETLDQTSEDGRTGFRPSPGENR